VRSQTQISPSGAEAIIDINWSRTGSPSALKAGASTPAVSAEIRCSLIGAQHGTPALRSVRLSAGVCFDIRLG
jgi:hypothetical protein